MSATASPLKITPHPYLPAPSVEEMEALLAREDGPAQLDEFLAAREARIAQAEADAFHATFEPEFTYPHGQTVRPWEDARALAAEADVDIVAVFGGNRAAKSHMAAHTIAQNVWKHARSLFVCLAEKEDTSITQQQSLIWHYFHPDLKKLNARKDPRHIFKINYSQANGFSDRKCVLPNRSEMHFLTYNQIATDYEGWEFGSKETSIVAVWADESLPLSWLSMFHRRLKFRRAKMFWTFTAVKGITPAMKELLGKTARTVRSLPAELLPNVRWQDCPRGHMPYIQVPELARTRAIYFHSIFNQFPTTEGETYYDLIRTQCEKRPSEYVQRIAYGVAKDTIARAFPNFGPWNVVKAAHVPGTGTNYRFVDPAGARNWFILWVRVSGGNPPTLYVYREFPDLERYGEWAVPTEREISAEDKKGWDGDPGPAQVSLGLGVVAYKQRMLAEEAGESIYESYMDPRAGRNPHADEHGGTCLLDEMNVPQRDPRTGKVEGPAMLFFPASGVREDDGITAINTLLEWDMTQPLMPVMNAPRLYVSERCANVIWALSNYTGRGGETGGCKDPIDCLRYMALAPLKFVTKEMMKTKGGGSY